MNESAALTEYTLDEMTELMKNLGQPAFRAKQLFSGLSAGKTVEEITNLPGALKEKLTDYPRGTAKIYQTLVSKDGTRKFLFLLDDGNIVEGVLMCYNYGNTVCISSQVGCAMGCKFCASTLEGKIRNLSAGEMLSEVAVVNRYAVAEGIGRVSNIVLMGSGEPLDNYDNLIRFLGLVNNADGLNIGRRNISVSTCGLAEKIVALAADGGGVTLSVSLHAPDDEIRKSIMPIANAVSIGELINSVRYYVKQTGRRAIFEYTIINGVNDGAANAEKLAALLRNLQCHVNLIPLNKVEERKLSVPSRRAVDGFKLKLEELGISCSVRREMGSDISGACGQLRRRVLNGENPQ